MSSTGRRRAALVALAALPLAFGLVALAPSQASATPGARIVARYHTTYGSGSFVVQNTSTAGEKISSISVDIGSAMFPDLLFDPDDGTPAGDSVSKSFTRTGGAVTAATGSQSEGRQDGYEVLTVATGGFGPGGDLKWAIDIDHSSVKGSSGTPAPIGGHVSGGELHGALVTVTFEGGATREGELVYDPAYGTDVNSRKATRVDVGGSRPAVGLARASGATPATVSAAAQQMVVTGPPGTPVRLVVAEGHMDLTNVPGNGFDVQPYEANTADGNTQNDPLRITQVAATIGAGGAVTVPVTLTRTAAPASRQSGLVTGLNYITAYAPSTGGLTYGHGPVTDPVVLKLDPSGTPTDTTAPTITARQPADLATNVAVSSNLVTTFSEALAPASVSATSVSLAPAAGGAAIAAALSLGSGNTVVTLNPSSDLAASTQYRATIGTAVTDAAGNALAAQDSWTFTTAPAPPTDTTAPTITARQPAAGASGVAVGANLVTTFSEALAPASVSASSVSLAPAAGGAAIAAALSLGSGNTVVTLNPSSDLAASTQYRATIRTGVTDAAGNQLAAPDSWTFTTAPATPPGGGAFLESGGQVVIEAESFSQNLTRSGKTWGPPTSPPAGAVGTSLQALPNSGTSVSTNVAATSPQLSYPVQFSSAGTYYVWARGFGASTADDSLHAGLDGQAPASANGMNFGALNKWVWFTKTLSAAAPATITVPSAGLHTVNLWMREDGAVIDRLLLTTNPATVPSGNGPAESPRAP